MVNVVSWTSNSGLVPGVISKLNSAFFKSFTFVWLWNLTFSSQELIFPLKIPSVKIKASYL